jgi:hypothetical protein
MFITRRCFLVTRVHAWRRDFACAVRIFASLSSEIARTSFGDAQGKEIVEGDGTLTAFVTPVKHFYLFSIEFNPIELVPA